MRYEVCGAKSLVTGVGNLLFEHARRELLGAFVSPLPHEARWHGQCHPSWHVQIAEDGREDEHGVAGLHPICVRVYGEPPHER